jgi:ubiquinone/menaquinone biosynthesis C-methylase UbiE
MSQLLKQSDFAGRDVLEVGCGAGRFTRANLVQARTILGIDPSAEAIATITSQWPAAGSAAQTDFRQGSIVDFPLPPAAFDVAVFSRSL